MNRAPGKTAIRPGQRRRRGRWALVTVAFLAGAAGAGALAAGLSSHTPTVVRRVTVAPPSSMLALSRQLAEEGSAREVRRLAGVKRRALEAQARLAARSRRAHRAPRGHPATGAPQRAHARPARRHRQKHPRLARPTRPLPRKPAPEHRIRREREGGGEGREREALEAEGRREEGR